MQQFRDYAELYLDTAALSLSSKLSYRDSLNIYWLPLLHDERVADIGYAQLLQIDHLIDWPSPKTRKNGHVALRGVFALAYLDLGLPLSQSPAHNIKLGRHQRQRPDPFSKSERDAILDWMISKRHGQYFRTAFATGMRSGELIALVWEHYHGDSITICQSRVRGQLKGTKTAHERRVYVPAWLREELDQYWTRPLGSAIFLNQYRRPLQKPDHPNRLFRRCLAALDIRPRRGPYPWRHTYASIGISEGVAPAFLARQLGHSLETFYRTYADWISADQDRAQRDALERTWG
jgi:integrase